MDGNESMYVETNPIKTSIANKNIYLKPQQLTMTDA